MAVKQEHVTIERPCPTTLDPARAAGGVRSWYCDHCEKSVHVLSNMTEPEARAFLAANEGNDICVSYSVQADGTIHFKAPTPPPPMIVPVESLARRRPAAAAIGLAAALAACTPHDNDRVIKPSVVVAEAPIRQGAPPVVPDVMVDGGLRAMPLPEPIPVTAGGIRPVPVPEPIQMKPGEMRAVRVPEPIADEPCEPTHAPRRGGIRARPRIDSKSSI